MGIVKNPYEDAGKSVQQLQDAFIEPIISKLIEYINRRNKMNFAEALEALKDGRQVVRDCWDEDTGYLVLMPNVDYVWKVAVLAGGKVNAGGYPFLVEDYEASDWMLLSEKCYSESVELADSDAA